MDTHTMSIRHRTLKLIRILLEHISVVDFPGERGVVMEDMGAGEGEEAHHR